MEYREKINNLIRIEGTKLGMLKEREVSNDEDWI